MSPSGPSARLRAVLGMAVGLFIAMAAIFTRRWLTDRVVSLDDAAQITGARPLGTVPWVGGWRRRAGLAEIVIRRRQDPITETVRGILYRLGVGDEDVCRVVMVTSPSQGDGKSTLIVAMARVAAQDGLRCIAIDCDFHRPSLARIVRRQPRNYLDQRGASNLLLPPIRDLVVEDLSGADFILARPVPHCSRAVFERLQLDGLIASLRSRYDLVLIDTPPLLHVVDPLFVSRVADTAILVLAYRGISRRLTLEVMERLRSFACALAGVVVSRARGEAVEHYAYRGYPARRDV
jgi:succinoglycan biosynthesis transport protein ExoP